MYILIFQNDDNEQSSNLRPVVNTLGHLEIFEKYRNAVKFQENLEEKHEQKTSIMELVGTEEEPQKGICEMKGCKKENAKQCEHPNVRRYAYCAHHIQFMEDQK